MYFSSPSCVPSLHWRDAVLCCPLLAISQVYGPNMTFLLYNQDSCLLLCMWSHSCVPLAVRIHWSFLNQARATQGSRWGVDSALPPHSLVFPSNRCVQVWFGASLTLWTALPWALLLLLQHASGAQTTGLNLSDPVLAVRREQIVGFIFSRPFAYTEILAFSRRWCHSCGPCRGG